eukprot:2724582-Heterocapsa_arctica.AAC.1
MPVLEFLRVEGVALCPIGLRAQAEVRVGGPTEGGFRAVVAGARKARFPGAMPSRVLHLVTQQLGSGFHFLVGFAFR